MKEFTKIYNLPILIVLTFVISSCNNKKDDTAIKKIETDTTLVIPDDSDTSFQKSLTTTIENRDLVNNPIAKNIWFKKLSNSEKSIILMADFGKKAFDNSHDFDIEGEKFTLHDDGKNGDEVAKDGIFSGIINAELKDFEVEIEKISLQKVGIGSKSFAFDGRSALINKPILNSKIELVDFKSLKRFPFERLRMAADPKLKDHSLMITAVPVVEDPTRTWNVCNKSGNINGPWTFKTLMKNLASTDPNLLVNDIQLSNFVENWLLNWATNRVINGENVPSRSQINNIINTWKANSQTLSPPKVPIGKLDMRAAPFKLTAIVNRLDLRGGSGYRMSSGGEGRFIFCLIDNCIPKKFNVILEYGIPKNNCSQIKSFATQWYNLKNMALGSTAYNTALQAITDQFTKCGTSPNKPNKSSLNQLRTNEIQFGSPWELREFTINPISHLLQEVTVKQEPAKTYNSKMPNSTVANLVNFINTNATSILNNNYVVPNTHAGQPFLGGKAHTEFSPNGPQFGINPHHWNGRTSADPTRFIISHDVRQNFSLNTCSGCHGGETQTFFTMVDPAPFGTQANLAGFLTGIKHPASSIDLVLGDNFLTVPDPAGRPSNVNRRTFNDLQRRADDLTNLVNTPCIGPLRIAEALSFRPLGMTH